jgi:peptidoglycan-N-acetylglucosamine deacetylase
MNLMPVMNQCFNAWDFLTDKNHWKIQPPAFLRWLFPGSLWRVNSSNKVVYITFDDGPIPEVTPKVIDCLKKFGAKATFFCVGDNVRKYPEVYNLLISQGMAVGNHTYSHIKAWSCNTNKYFKDIEHGAVYIKSALFRPPHGQLYPWYVSKLKKRFAKIVMWDILSMDYDSRVTANEIVNNVVKKIRPGSIIVFHDSLKAWPRLNDALPKVLAHINELGYKTEIIS